MMKKNQARTVVRSEAPFVAEQNSEQKKKQRFEMLLERRKKFNSTAEVLANSKICQFNWMYPGAKEKFPNDIEMHYVRRRYPLAAGGPLLIDEPQRPDEIEACARKGEFLRSLGFRYIAIEPQMHVDDLLIKLSEQKHDMAHVG